MVNRQNPFWAIGAIAGMALLLVSAAGCGNSSANTNVAKGCMKIGVLLPDNGSSSRWETKDHPALQHAIAAALPGAQIDFTNANGSQDVQLSQAETDLNQGDCILVAVAQDSTTAASIVEEAHTKGVPVIAYDRLINDATLDYYVSFNGMDVGAAQGKYILAHYQQYVAENKTTNVVLISGSKTDNNALLFSKGLHQILDPLFSTHALSNQGESFTLDWDGPTAETEIEQYLARLHNAVSIVYVANDAMAATVIDALTHAHLNGKVLVTGQDASAEGIQQILLGNQMMTVYKPISQEAQATARLVAALSKGSSTASLASMVIADSGRNVPAILLPVESVDKTNIASTVLADGFVTKAAICQGVPAGTDGLC